METFTDLFPSVHDLLSVKEALGRLANCERAIKTQGPTTILQNAHIIYTCLRNVKDLKSETIDEIMHFLIKGLNLLEIDLKKLLKEKLSDDNRVKYLNTLKLFVYLIVEFSNFIEKKTCKDAQDAQHDLLSSSMNKKNTKRKKQTNMDSDTSSFDWNLMKEKLLDALSKILLLNIQKLWDPPIAEEPFVELITNMCYKLMENASLTRNKTIREHLCHVLSIMIRKYNHSYGACVMIIQTLSHYDHLNVVYADLVQTCVAQTGYSAILPDLLRELRHHINTIDVKTGNKENPNIKFYSQFLIELGERIPQHLMNDMGFLFDYLDEESYLMRNAVLFILGEIICKVLNEETTTSDLNMKKRRNDYLDTLCEHIHDCNAITRSKSLQIWRKICDEKKMPLQYQSEIMKRCVGRMEDMASSVRKSAFQLLCDMIKQNPYGIKSIQVSIEEMENEYKKELNTLNELKQQQEQQKERENVEGDDIDVDQEGEEDGEESGDKDQQQQQKDKQNDQIVEKIVVQTTKVNYLKDMISFIKQIESVIPKLTQLLFSKTQTDVIEVISFFVTCYEHGLVDMLVGIRKMLTLILNAEKTVKDAVIDAYRRLYLSSTTSGAANNSVLVAKQLIKLTQNLTVCEYEALEQLIGAFTDSGELDNSVIQILWELFTLQSDTMQITDEQSIGALILLSMIIKKVPDKGKANIQVLIDYGLNKEIKNLYKVTQTCIALTNVCSQSNTKQVDLKEQFKLPSTHKLFDNLSEIIVSNFNNRQTTDWIPMVEAGLTCIFKMCDDPLLICETLVLRLIELIKPLNKFVKVDELSTSMNNSSEQMITEQPAVTATAAGGDEENSQYNCDSFLLTRFMSFIGFMSLKFLVFVNTAVVCELKRRRTIKEDNDIAKKSQSNRARKRRSKAPRQSMSRRSMVNSMSGEIDLQEEMGLQGAEAEDAEQVFIEQLLEKKVSFNGLLTKFISFAAIILKEPNKYSDEKLQLSSAMALVRMMCISRRFCSDYLQLLFTIMEKSTSVMVRSQLILGIGDLFYLFPNPLEPWTSRIYTPLRDKSVLVRTNTIRVLSHLILKQMIISKGHMYEIALCTIDEDLKIKCLAKLFFNELSKRDNGSAIYNALPDMISRLSECSTDTNRPIDLRISEEQYRQIVSYLFSFIRKDKQCETLMENLTNSFKNANTDRKCRDLAFCLSKVNLSDNSIKKLFETYKNYEDKLSIPEVCDIFRQILKNSKKIQTLKVETKKLLEELEKKIDETLQKGLNENNNQNAENNGDEENRTVLQQSLVTRGTRRETTKLAAKKKPPPPKKKKHVSSTEESESESSDSSS